MGSLAAALIVDADHKRIVVQHHNSAAFIPTLIVDLDSGRRIAAWNSLALHQRVGKRRGNHYSFIPSLIYDNEFTHSQNLFRFRVCGPDCDYRGSADDQPHRQAFQV
jgi:hypothetical protein